MMPSHFIMCMVVLKIMDHMVGRLEQLVQMVLLVQIGGKHLGQMGLKPLLNQEIQIFHTESFNKELCGE